LTTQAVLNDLIETLEDGRKGFAEGSEKLRKDGESELAGTFLDLSRQRERFSLELQHEARRHNITVEPDGSTLGALHRGWMTLKDALAGDNPDGVLDAAERGENHAMGEYRKALDSGDLHGPLRTIVERQAIQVEGAHDKVQAMGNAVN
jgi:uncharacterized protein (TIGR02284 family)